ncbi:MAG: lysophospholipid acyltransferase family protein [Caldilineaceae bacterium]
MSLPHDASRLWKALHRFITFVLPLFCRLQVEGREHIPHSGGCIVACNHSMGPDYLMLGYASTRQIFYMAKSELFQIHPWLSRFLGMAGVFPIKRGQKDLEAIGTAEELVLAGRVLGMFPEGTRSRSGCLQRGKSGVTRIAMAAQTPVVPAVVINSRAVFKLGQRPQVVVRFGPSLTLQGNPQDKVSLQQNTEAIMYAIADLLPPGQRGPYERSNGKAKL